MPTGTAVLALDIGATKLAAGIGAPDGEVSRLATAPTNASEGAESLRASVIEQSDLPVLPKELKDWAAGRGAK